MINRRNLMRLGAGAGTTLLLGSVWQRQALAQDDEISSTALTADTALLSGSGCNVLVSKAASGELLVVDGGLGANADRLLDAITSRMGSERISTLVNTHWHPEHTGLNAELGSRDVRIFAHENTRQWLSTTIARPWEERRFEPLAESARPTDVFYHYGDFQHGNVAVQYGYLRQAHTDGDMYVYLPEANILHAGGIINGDSWPLMDWWTGGWIGGLVDGIETLLSVANDDTVIIPAHGPLIDRAQLQAMRDMYAEIFDVVRGRFMQASTVEETVAAKPAAKWENQFGNADMFIELSHWSLIPHYTPDA